MGVSNTQFMSLFTFLLVPAATVASVSLQTRAVDCAFATTADAGATCQSFASSWGLSFDDLKALNPGISCPNLDTSKTYCVIGEVTDDPEPSSTSKVSSTTLKTSTTMKTSAPTASPTMPGLAANCDGFYKVSSGDTCAQIVSANGISLSQFHSWNSEIDDNCTNLWFNYYVCVHVPGATPTSATPSPTPTAAPGGPTPQMPGIVDECTDFYQVKSGDSCWTIYTDAGITFEQFRQWNTEVNADCSNLWLGYYVCVGV